MAPMQFSFFSKIWEGIILLGIAFKTQVFNFFEFCTVVRRFYTKAAFAKADLSLIWSYLFCSPYRMSKRFLLERGEKEIFTYGETPLTTMEKIVRESEITRDDVVFELGCGRGRTCFWLSQFFGCTAIGLEKIPIFIEKASAIKKRLHLQDVFFRLEDIFHTDFKGATVLYLYGTCLLEDEISLLIQYLGKLPAGTKIITVSYPLSDIEDKAPFRLIKQFRGRFPWGKTDIFLQVVDPKKRINRGVQKA